MYRLLNILIIVLLVFIGQNAFKVSATAASDGHRVERRNPGKRIQLRPGKAESNFFKIQNSKSESDYQPVQNPDIDISSAIIGPSVTPSKTTHHEHDNSSSFHEKRAKTCPAQPLPSGRCTCSDQTFCSGTCVKLANSHENCGACAHRCGKDQTCESGTCICKGLHLSACNRSCVDLSDNENNCGRCGHSCGRGKTCVAGLCIRL